MRRDTIFLAIAALIVGLVFAGLMAVYEYLSGNPFSLLYFVLNTVLFSLMGFAFELWNKRKKRNKS